MSSLNSVCEFYANQSVFITGASGFLGKIIVEKLLRSCPEVSKIFILLRQKHGVSSNDRYSQFTSSLIFKKLRREQVLEKLFFIDGDLLEPDLGISYVDLEMLFKETNVVIHAGATVRFNERLSIAGRVNTLATKNLMEMSLKMTELKSFVYVSTAFVNAKDPKLESVEKVSLKLEMDPNTFLHQLQTQIPDKIDLLEKELKIKPNTYIFTKRMCEAIINEYFDLLPICIIRPSIITASVSEPFPGYVDNLNGATGFLMGVGLGSLKVFLGKLARPLDIIPVDTVANSVINVAYLTSKKENCGKVYNCTSSEINPIKLKKIITRTLETFDKLPTKHLIFPPSCYTVTSKILFRILFIMWHFIPSLHLDLVARMLRKKPKLWRISKSTFSAIKSIDFVTLNDLQFDTTNMKQMIKMIKREKSMEMFNCDIGSIQWDEYMVQYIVGIKKFILKDTELDLSEAQKKLKRLKITLFLFKWGYIILKAFLYFKAWTISQMKPVKI